VVGARGGVRGSEGWRGAVQSRPGQLGSLQDIYRCQNFRNVDFQDSASKVFDEMPARIGNSNFLNFQIGLVIILDKGSKTIFISSIGVELLQGYFKFGMSSVLDSNFGYF
jgi:hypothetical protein